MNQYIEIRTNQRGLPRPFIVGTRVRVQDIVSDHERYGMDPESIAANLDSVTLSQVFAALSYFFDNKEDIWSCIREDEAYAASHISGRASGGTDAEDDTLSS